MKQKKTKKKTVAKLNYGTLKRLYQVFGRYYKKHWKSLAVAYLGLMLTVLVALLMPWPLKLILDYVILQKPLPAEAAFITEWVGDDLQSLLMALVIAFMILRLADSVVSYIHKVGLLSVGEKMLADIRQQVFSHLQRLSLTFHGLSRSGDLVYRLTSDINKLKAILVQLPDAAVYRLVTIVSHIGLMLFLEWRLALVALAVLPLLYYYHRRLGSGVQRATKEKRKKESEVSSLVAENVTAMALVQAYGREDLQQSRFSAENRQSLESGITAMRLSKVFKRVSDILMALGTAAVIYWGGRLALEQAILPGTLVLFASYLRNLYRPVEKFAALMLDIAQAQVSGERLLEIVECDMVMSDAPEAREAPALRGLVEFRDVTFAYKKALDVLKGVSFQVKPGETVALVGHSGAGKSTLISLLLRFYDPQEGAILVDDSNIRSLTLKSLRAQITVLLQDARLFNQSVRENIAFGKTDATEEEIVEAARLAQAHDFIMAMTQGYETIISEGGDNLSGGQKQRINIARAIIRNTPILILDEPATALDARAETLIREAVDKLKAGKTTFIIAHRFATIAHADRILVLERGRVVGFGQHSELLRQCQTYRELYELQFGSSEVEEPVLTEPLPAKPKAVVSEE